MAKKITDAVTDADAGAQLGTEVTKIRGSLEDRLDDAHPGTAISGFPDPTDPANTPPVAYTIRALRPQGIWRAGRFWGPDDITVTAAQFTLEQEVQLLDEPLLLVTPIIEAQE